MLELDHFITHAFERTPPTHEMAVRPRVIFTLTFKARNADNRVLDIDNLVKVLCRAIKNRIFSFRRLYLNSLSRRIPYKRLAGP